MIADATNNLSDAVSSVATLVGFRMASKKGDREHPFGHARIEYMTGLVIAALIIYVGIRLATSSVDKVLHPSPMDIGPVETVLTLLLIFVKLWLWAFYRRLGRDIDSLALKAAGVDSRNDVIVSSAILASLLCYLLTGYNVDGYTGGAVALFIIFSGLSLMKETIAPLLGQPPDPALIKHLTGLILSYPNAIGLHDLILHDYGPGRVFATAHVEVDAYEDIMHSHEMLDEMEVCAKNRFGVELVCHMDPVDTRDPQIRILQDIVKRSLEDVPGVLGQHDFRIVRGPHRTNVIFDVVLTQAKGCTAEEEVGNIVQRALFLHDPALRAVVSYDIDYSGGKGQG
jgi:cation diffusion facilitator family transporter